MGAVREAVEEAFRDYVTDGVPASGDNKPDKQKVRYALGELLETTLAATGAAISRYKTKALMDAVTSADDGQLAYVFFNADDAGDANNKYYQWDDVAASWIDAEWLNDVTNNAVTQMTATNSKYLGENIAGPITPASGTAAPGLETWFWPTSQKTYDQGATSLEVNANAKGSVEIVTALVEGDGTLTRKTISAVSVEAGTQTIPIKIPLPAGHVIGLRQPLASTLSYAAGTIPNSESIWYTSGVVGTNTAKTVATSNGLNYRITLDAETLFEAEKGSDSASTVGETVTQGWDTIVNTGTTIGANFGIFFPEPAPADGIIKKVKIGASGSGSVNIIVFELNPETETVTAVISSTPGSLIDGVAEVEKAIPIAAGQYYGIQGGGYKFQSSANNNPAIAVRLKQTTPLAVSDVLTWNAQHRYEVHFEIQTGLVGDVSKALSGSGTNNGLGLLNDADFTGVSDATSLVTAAKASHDFPYVSTGKIAVTSLDAKGGLYGPGKVLIDGEELLIPPHPTNINLYDGLRAVFAEAIANNDVLALISDSRGHFAYSDTGPEHRFNRLTRHLNLGIAKDEPIMTALRPSSTYTPAFYGVTVTGTVSTGTEGPLSESLIMASGAAMSFVGTYAEIGVFARKTSGAGTLTFSGSITGSIGTLDANGAEELDAYSGHSTTSTVEETWTITASGGSVTVTGLNRLGVKVADTAPRLCTGRFAHGSYTFADFDEAAMTSIIKQCTYAGGKILPIIDLGINDSFSTVPATIKTNADFVIDKCQTAGATMIIGMLPSKPSSAWDASYSSGRSYESAMGSVVQAYREQGVIILPTDALDFAAEGLTFDGLHDNQAGNDRTNRISAMSMVEKCR